jgi:Ca2+-binding EF-hand superfamily protein
VAEFVAENPFSCTVVNTGEGGGDDGATTGLSAEETDNMKLLFQKYDKDGNGVMDAGELGEFIKSGKSCTRVLIISAT